MRLFQVSQFGLLGINTIERTGQVAHQGSVSHSSARMLTRSMTYERLVARGVSFDLKLMDGSSVENEDLHNDSDDRK